jgi:hypothetical protein
LRVVDTSTWKNFSKSRCEAAAGMPIPLSETSTRITTSTVSASLRVPESVTAVVPEILAAGLLPPPLMEGMGERPPAPGRTGKGGGAAQDAPLDEPVDI